QNVPSMTAECGPRPGGLAEEAPPCAPRRPARLPLTAPSAGAATRSRRPARDATSRSRLEPTPLPRQHGHEPREPGLEVVATQRDQAQRALCLRPGDARL